MEPPAVVLRIGAQGAAAGLYDLPVLRRCSEATAPRKVLLAACDVYRPAAIKQLQLLGEQVGWTRWTAVCLGFAGTLLAVGPTRLTLSSATVLVLLFALFVYLRMGVVGTA